MRKTCISDFGVKNRWFDWLELMPAPCHSYIPSLPSLFPNVVAGGGWNWKCIALTRTHRRVKWRQNKKTQKFAALELFRHFLDHSGCHSGNSMIRWESSTPSAAHPRGRQAESLRCPSLNYDSSGLCRKSQLAGNDENVMILHYSFLVPVSASKWMYTTLKYQVI